MQAWSLLCKQPELVPRILSCLSQEENKEISCLPDHLCGIQVFLWEERVFVQWDEAERIYYSLKGNLPENHWIASPFIRGLKEGGCCATFVDWRWYIAIFAGIGFAGYNCSFRFWNVMDYVNCILGCSAPEKPLNCSGSCTPGLKKGWCAIIFGISV